MAKMKLNVDWKKLLVEKGERASVILAGVVSLAMLVPMFGFLFFGHNSSGLIAALNEPAKQLKDKQQTAKPEGASTPAKGSAGSNVLTMRPQVEPSKYQTAQLITPTIQLDSTKRQPPHIFTPVEGYAGVGLTQLRLYNWDASGEKVMKVKGGNTSTNMSDYNKNLQAAYQGAGQNRGRGNSNPRYSTSTQKPDKPDLENSWIPTDDIGSLGAGEKLADKVQPARLAIVDLSFPYRKQIEEFQHRLHRHSLADVVDETVVEDMADTSTTEPNQPNQLKQPKHTFNFLPPRVERRLVDVHGNPTGEWAPLDLEGNYMRLVYDNGQRFEPESDKLLAVSFENLVMPKLELLGKNQYPNVESKLSELQTTLAKLDAKPEVKKPNFREPPPGFSAFSPRPKTKELRTGMGPGSDRRPPPPPGIGPMRPGDPKKLTDPNEAYPEYCLIRLIDVSINPGQYYQYRVKVRMSNPNYGMKNVASPAYAESKEPLESDWFEVRLKKDEPPQVVVAPPEYHLYAVDQQDLIDPQKEKYTGQNAGASKDRKAVFQIHKWLLETNPPLTLPVGEWSVAERVLVHRGEYIGVRERVEVPYWRSEQDNFVFAKETTISGVKNPPKEKGIEVDFGLPLIEGAGLEKPYPILVDFEGGDVTYNRVIGKDDKGMDKKIHINYKTDVETLILSPDGKLLELNSWTAKADKEREKRLKEWHERLKEVREGKATAPGGSTDILGGKP